MAKTSRYLTRRCLLQTGLLMSAALLGSCAAPTSPSPQATSGVPVTPAATAASKPAPAPTVNPTAAPTARSFAPAPVNIVDPGSSSHKATAKLVKNQGYFEQFGLIENVQGMQSDKAIPGLLSGAVDLALFLGLSTLFAAVAQGATLKVVGGCRIPAPSLIATAQPAIKTVKDLEGKTIGTGAMGAPLHQIAMALLKKHGVDSAKVEMVNIGNSTDVLRAVIAKKIDAGITDALFIPTMEKSGVTYFAEVWKELPDFVSAIAFTSDQAIAQKRDVLVRALAAYGQVFRFMRQPESKDPFVKAITEVGGSAEDGEFDWRWNRDNKAFAYDLALTERQIGYMQQLTVDVGTLKATLPFDKVADMSLAQDALKIMTVR